MLQDIEGNPVNRNPHQAEYDNWCNALAESDLVAMQQAINDYTDDRDELQASFLPGKSPEIKALFPRLTAACGGDEEQAGLFFGNIVWRVIYDRSENWRFTRTEGVEGMFYWCINR